jgi:hypothetical protein
MALITKYSSSKEIINKLYRDTGIQMPLNYDDLTNWIFEVMEIVGFPLQYIPRIVGYLQDTRFDYTEYKIPLPCDFHKLRAIAVNGYPALPSTSSFHELLDGNCCGMNPSSSDSEIFTDNFGNTFDSSIGPIAGATYAAPITFSINSDFMTFNLKAGKACLAYWAFPIDKDGFPLIPDDEIYKIAVTKYLTTKIDYIVWRQDPDSRGKRALYDESMKEYSWYIGKLTSHLKMPSVEQMENLKNQMIRMKPNIQHFNSFFNSLGQNQGYKN